MMILSANVSTELSTACSGNTGTGTLWSGKRIGTRRDLIRSAMHSSRIDRPSATGRTSRRSQLGAFGSRTSGVPSTNSRPCVGAASANQPDTMDGAAHSSHDTGAATSVGGRPGRT